MTAREGDWLAFKWFVRILVLVLVFGGAYLYFNYEEDNAIREIRRAHNTTPHYQKPIAPYRPGR